MMGAVQSDRPLRIVYRAEWLGHEVGPRSSRPWKDFRSAVNGEPGDQGREVIDVCGQYRLRQPDRDAHEVGIDDIGHPSASQDHADRVAVVERVNRDAAEEPRQASLPGTAAPYLCDHRMRRAERRLMTQGSGEKLLRRAVPPIERDQEPRVEDQRS